MHFPSTEPFWPILKAPKVEQKDTSIELPAIPDICSKEDDQCQLCSKLFGAFGRKFTKDADKLEHAKIHSSQNDKPVQLTLEICFPPKRVEKPTVVEPDLDESDMSDFFEEEASSNTPKMSTVKSVPVTPAFKPNLSSKKPKPAKKTVKGNSTKKKATSEEKRKRPSKRKSVEKPNAERQKQIDLEETLAAVTTESNSNLPSAFTFNLNEESIFLPPPKMEEDIFVPPARESEDRESENKNKEVQPSSEHCEESKKGEESSMETEEESEIVQPNLNTTKKSVVYTANSLDPGRLGTKIGFLVSAQCRLCDEMVVQHMNYQRRHVWKEHMGNPAAVFCPVCDFSSGIELFNVKQHLRKHHKDVSNPKIIDKRSEFGEQLQTLIKRCFDFPTKKRLWRRQVRKVPFSQRRQLPNTYARLFCELCEENVYQSRQKEHIWNVHMPDSTAFVCPICRFSVNYNPKAILDHMSLIHNSEQPFLDKRPEKAEEYYRMRRKCFNWKPTSMHVKERLMNPMNSETLTCFKCFEEIPNIVYHKSSHVWRVHLGNPIGFACPLCPFTTGQSKQYIQIHMANVHGESNTASIIDKRQEIEGPYRTLMKECFGKEVRKIKRRKVGMKWNEKKCLLCCKKVEIRGPFSVKEHIWRDHMGNPLALECGECPKKYNFVMALLSYHLKSTHDSTDLTKIVDNRPLYQEELNQFKAQCFGMKKRRTKVAQSNVPSKECRVCKKSVQIINPLSLKNHIWTHMGNPMALFCPECPRAYGYELHLLKYHIRSTHGEEPLLRILDRRMEYHNELVKWKKLCFGLTGKRGRNFAGEGNKKVCKLCNISVCDQRFVLKAHVWKHHLGNPKALKCPHCDYSTTLYTTAIKKHLFEFHNSRKLDEAIDERKEFNEEANKLLFSCFGLKVKNKRGRKGKSNTTSVHGRKVCNVCKESVSDLNLSKRDHVWRHHLGNPTAFSCPYCEFKTGFQVSVIKQHMERKHSDKDPSTYIDNRPDLAAELGSMGEKCFGKQMKLYSSTKGPMKTCLECKIEVPMNNVLTNFKGHVWRFHMGLGPSPPFAYKCPKCDYHDPAFLSSSMYNHMHLEHPESKNLKPIDLRKKYRDLCLAKVQECFDYIPKHTKI